MKCSVCGRNFAKKGFLIDHVGKMHPEAIPPTMSIEQFVYFGQHGSIKGKCMCGCGKDTAWNDKTGKPFKISPDQNCRKRVRETAVKNGADGHLLTSMDHQKKMQQGRKIAGTFVFPDGGKIGYLAKNELAFLKFCVNICEFTSRMIVESPVIIDYDDNGTPRKYIPDYYLPDYKLLVEIKANNTNPAYMTDTGYKVELKDGVMKKQDDYNFIKIIDNKFGPFLEILFNIVSDSGKKEKDVRVILENVAEWVPVHYDNIYLIYMKDAMGDNRNIAISGASSLSQISYFDQDGVLHREVGLEYPTDVTLEVYRYIGDANKVDKVLNFINNPSSYFPDEYCEHIIGIMRILHDEHIIGIMRMSSS